MSPNLENVSSFENYPQLIVFHSLFESQHDNTNKVTAPSEDSDQPRHPPSLIRIFCCSLSG